MTTNTDWDSNADTMPQVVNAPDLFGGELFGDELIDIYHSAEDEMMDSAIPTLLGAAPDHAPSTKTSLAEDHPGAQMAMEAAAMDDGFGAFRPSTSFNDLTSLAGPPSTDTNTATTSAAPVAPAVPPAATKAKIAPKKASGRKRAATTSDGPAAKKRGTAKSRATTTGTAATRRASTKTTKASTRTAQTPVQSAGQAALKLRKEQRALLSGKGGAKSANGTPNPLSSAVSKAAAAATVKATSKPIKAATVPSAIVLPVGITPKTIGSGKGDSITSEAAAATAAAAAVAAAATAAAAATTTVPTAVPSSKRGATTEADFKSVAQAAVTNLILNAGSAKQKADAAAAARSGRVSAEPGTFNGKVDTSTEHIKALTSSNWVNACGGGETAASAQAAADTKANNRARRQNLTPDERARQNRDRNREHARNTRLRKKAYVEELKRTLTELVSQRDAAELEKKHAVQRELEQREVRFRVMEEFMKLRGKGDTNLNRWAAILEDGFSLTLPVTPYRKMVHGKGGASTQQVLKGAKEVMTDSTYIAALLGNLKNQSNPKSTVSLVYRCERKRFFMDDSSAVLDFAASVVGGQGQITVKGIMRAEFSPASNKLISAEFIFDASNVAAQLGRVKARLAMDNCDEVTAAAAAAHEADALLDSIQMPALNSVPTAISVGGKESHCVTCSESSDESMTEVPPRRSTRQKN